VIARAVVVVVLAWCAVAAAETRRVAVVVGSNTGNQDQTPLRYAEIDAMKVARVLAELGGVEAADLYVILGKDLATLSETLRRAKAKITAYQSHGDRVIAIFYYSGHSDGVALELGRDRFAFAALRDWLKDTGADVRLALVDSCKSGALLATKGGTPGPAFHIRLTDELSSTGEALLTSSAADENALESREIGGSFFTHHLVSGLRGAADESGDGRVTLSEAYHYAYKHTITTSGATLAGPQHPTYDYRLSGQGELILTELARPSAGLALPDGFDRALVIDVASQQVIAELGRGDPARVALVPGRYTIRAWKAAHAYAGTLAVAAGQLHAVTWSELAETAPLTTSRKGGDVTAAFAPAARGNIELAVAGGGRAGVANQIAAVGSLRAGVRVGALTFAVDGGTQRDGALRESNLFAAVGYRRGLVRGPLRASLGLELGGGMILQTIDGRSASGAATLAPVGELAVAASARVSLALTAELPATLLKRDGELAITALPAAWLGVIVIP
jgi:caspase domain-containing protein